MEKIKKSVNNEIKFVCIREKTCFLIIEFGIRLEVSSNLNINQDMLIQQIADREDINVATVRKLFKSAEDIIFDYLSSIPPSDEITIKLFNGISIKRKYIKARKYSRGMFKNIDCPEHVSVKTYLSKYYNGQVNQKLFGLQ